MNALQINQTADLVTLVGCGNLRKVGTYHIGPCPFCGGHDRFTIKHTQEGDRWHCRHCGDGKYHTAIDFIMQRDNVDFKNAFQTLTGENPAPIRMLIMPRAKPASKPITLPSTEWQAKALKKMDMASDCLLESSEGHAGREYLTRRGISRPIWEAWNLGFTMRHDPTINCKRPAIVIPWLDMNAETEVITAIKYRFIEDSPKELRYILLAGSIPLLFGLWTVINLT